MTDECGVCDEDLDGEYTIHIYEVQNPVKSGYLNRFSQKGLVQQLPGTDPHELHLPVCADCDAPDVPPEPEGKIHHRQLTFYSVSAGLLSWALLDGRAVESPTFVTAIAVAFTVIAVGEYLQLHRIRERQKTEMWRDWDVTPVLADDGDGGETPQQKFVTGEIDEDELEARLDEKFAKTDGEQRELVMER